MDKEQRTLAFMIEYYCRKKHGTAKGEYCASCNDLLTYAQTKLEKCPYREDKPACSECKVHCYHPIYRTKIREVMLFTGPRMLFLKPGMALEHLWQKYKPQKHEKDT